MVLMRIYSNGVEHILNFRTYKYKSVYNINKNKDLIFLTQLNNCLL